MQENVTVVTENSDQKFAEWLAVARYCPKHPRTRLVPGARKRLNLFDRMRNMGEIENDTVFKETFGCPACRRAYALYPPEFIQAGFDTFETNTDEQVASLAVSRAYVEQVNKLGVGFLVFVGMPGTGKTRHSANIVGELREINALYVRQGELINALRATYGLDKYEYDEFDRKIGLIKTPLQITQAAEMFVLDEIGCTAPANDERMLLDELLKHRYEQKKPTILISNLPLKQLNEFLGQAIADRIHQATGGGNFIFTFKGESYRRSAGENYLRGND